MNKPHTPQTEARIRTYYQTISAKGKEVIKQKKAEGQTMHLAPLGYRNVRINGRSVIEPDPETYLLVQEARSMYERQCSIRKICKVMEGRGLRSKRGKVLGPSSMLSLLRQCGKSHL